MQIHYPLNPTTGIEDQSQLPWSDGVPQTGQNGSFPPHAAVVEPMTELANLIAQAGLTGTSADLFQVLRAIRGGQLDFDATDTGTADAMVAQVGLAHTQLQAGLPFTIVKGPAANTGTKVPTLTITDLNGNNGLTGNVVKATGGPLAKADLPGNALLTMRVIAPGVFAVVSLVTLSDIAAAAGVIRVTDSANASTAQALVGTASPAISAYSPSQIFIWTAGANNTGPNPTLNVTGAGNVSLGTLTIVKKDTSVLAANDLLTGTTYFGSPDVTGSRLRVLGALPSDILALAPKFAGRIIGVQTITTSGTYTPTPGMTFCIVEGVAGGAAGAGASGASGAGNVSIGAPGTAGTYGRAYFTAAQIGAGQPATIGAGGVPVSGGAGGAGGTTSLGSLLSLPGGVGGAVLQNQVAPTINSNGTFSGSASGANIMSTPGSVQSSSLALTSGIGIGGQGGSNPLGAGGFGSGVNSTVAPGAGYGSGGAGTFVNSAGGSIYGGAGRPGVLIITEYGYTS